MVKVTFNSALAQKELKKEEKDEALIPQEGVSEVHQSHEHFGVVMVVVVFTESIFINYFFPGLNLLFSSFLFFKKDLNKTERVFFFF